MAGETPRRPKWIAAKWHRPTVSVLVPMCFDPSSDYTVSEVAQSSVFCGLLFATAELTALSLCRRRLRLSLSGRVYVQAAAVGFGIGAVAMPAGAWIRDRTVSSFSESFKVGFYNAKQKLLKRSSTATPPAIAQNNLKKELTKIGQFADFLGECVANLGLPLVAYSLWVGGIYQPLLAASLPNPSGLRLRRILLTSIRNASLWLLIGTVPGIFGLLSIIYLYPNSAGQILTVLYALAIFGLVCRSSYRLRSILYSVQTRASTNPQHIKFSVHNWDHNRNDH